MNIELDKTLSNLEMMRLCAEAMGITIHLIAEPEFHYSDCPYYEIPELSERPNEKYDPLHDDAQAMALVKKMNLAINPPNPDWRPEWSICPLIPDRLAGGYGYVGPVSENVDLNRAIVECCAKMQQAKND